jgi:hypothetical protein
MIYGELAFLRSIEPDTYSKFQKYTKNLIKKKLEKEEN